MSASSSFSSSSSLQNADSRMSWIEWVSWCEREIERPCFSLWQILATFTDAVEFSRRYSHTKMAHCKISFSPLFLPLLLPSICWRYDMERGRERKSAPLYEETGDAQETHTPVANAQLWLQMHNFVANAKSNLQMHIRAIAPLQSQFTAHSSPPPRWISRNGAIVKPLNLGSPKIFFKSIPCTFALSLHNARPRRTFSSLFLGIFGDKSSSFHMTPHIEGFYVKKAGVERGHSRHLFAPFFFPTPKQDIQSEFVSNWIVMTLTSSSLSSLSPLSSSSLSSSLSSPSSSSSFSVWDKPVANVYNVNRWMSRFEIYSFPMIIHILISNSLFWLTSNLSSLVPLLRCFCEQDENHNRTRGLLELS